MYLFAKLEIILSLLRLENEKKSIKGRLYDTNSSADNELSNIQRQLNKNMKISRFSYLRHGMFDSNSVRSFHGCGQYSIRRFAAFNLRESSILTLIRTLDESS